MDIQYIKSNIGKMTQNELVSLLSDMILDNVTRIENYDRNKAYRITDRVYSEESGTHCVYECIVNGATGSFDKTKWRPLAEVYTGPAPIFYTIRIREEVVTPNTDMSTYTVKLDYDEEQTSIAIYSGMKRLIKDVDFTINGKTITFNSSIKSGNRIIIELRERLGIIPDVVAGIVLYDNENRPYTVVIDNRGRVSIKRINRKDNQRDVKCATLLYGDKRYTLMVDSSQSIPVLELYEDVRQFIKTRDGKIYSISVTNNKMTVTYEPYLETGIDFIMGTDKLFYEFDISGDVITPVLKDDPSLSPNDFNVGFRMRSTEFQHKMLDVRNGKLRLIDYMPNTAYNNIRLRSKGNNTVYNITLNDELELEMHDNTNVEGTASPIMDELYFYNYNLENWKMYIDNDRLIYESCPEGVVRDSRGINIISTGGILSKIIVVEDDKVDTIRFADFAKMGTFKSPLENGFIVSEGNAKKLIGVDINGDRLIVTDADDDAVFKTNEHYILGSDSRLYKFVYDDSNVSVSLCNPSEYVMENKRSKILLKCHDVINLIDVNDSSIRVLPISTFTHTLKSTDGRKFLLGVIGSRGREVVRLHEINADHPYNDTGVGYLYIRNLEGECYKGDVHNSSLRFTKVEYDPLIDYDITSVAYTSNGWYKFELSGTTLTMRKIFNNINYPGMCYELAREFVLESEDDVKFSLSANGNGDLVIEPVENINVPGIFFRSSDDKVYCLGIVNNSIGTYRSYIEKSVKIEKNIYMRDIITGRYNMIYMREDRLVIEAIPVAPSIATKEIYVYNNYDDRFILVCANNKLMLVEDILEGVKDRNGNVYKVSIERKKLKFTKVKGGTAGIKAGSLKLTDLITGYHYHGYVEKNIITYENSDVSFNSPTQAIKLDNGDLYILSLFEGKISMTQIQESPTSLSDKEVEDYVPRMLEFENIFDGIRIYQDVINTEGYVMYNLHDLVEKNGQLSIEDVDDERLMYTIPKVTRRRPDATVVCEDIETQSI